MTSRTTDPPVCTGPGATAFTRTPLGLNSAAQARVIDDSDTFAVCRGPRETDFAGHAADVDDAPLAPGHHPRCERGHEEERRADVTGEQGVELLHLELRRRAEHSKPRWVKKLKRTFPPALTDAPSPALRLAFPPVMPHTHLQRRQQERRWRKPMDWKHFLAYITGSVDQELLLRNEYLVTENQILRQRMKGCVRLNDGERKTLAAIGRQLGKQALEEIATRVKPDTIFAWHRKFVAQKCDGSQQRNAPGRPKTDRELEALVVRMARENRSWGYDRMAGALKHLGYTISAQTVGNILKRYGIPPASQRKGTTTWKEFIRTHMDVLVATDFFTTEVWTACGLVTYYVLFFIHVGSRKIHVAGITPSPDQRWMAL
jgi:transposase